jgi:phosphoribosylglycinamide formyltransferase 1
MTTHKLGILISGRGSNMIAILDEIGERRLEAEAVVVISNIESAPGLSKARERGVETLFVSHKGRTREEHDRELVAEFKRREVSLVCLAGYMRLISPFFVRSFHNRILNVHPSLLPSFPGLDAQRQAIEHGVKVSGCTVHLVDEHLDHGPIVLQRAVEVREDDTVETLSSRILEQEHLLYPQAIARVLAADFRIEGRRTFLLGDV